jgi:photosystem II stability/assembly factor-like uncharacterized protein
VVYFPLRFTRFLIEVLELTLKLKKRLLLLSLGWLACHPAEKHAEIPQPSTQAAPQAASSPGKAASQPNLQTAPAEGSEAGVGLLQNIPSNKLTFVPRELEEEKLSRRILQELDALSFSERGTLRYNAESKAWQAFALPGDPQVLTLSIDARGALFALTETQLFQSIDQGVSWELASKLTIKPAMLWIDPRGALFVSGTSGELLRSGDQGKTWEGLKTGAKTLASLWGDEEATFAVTIDGTLLRSTNHGDNWSTLKTPTKEKLTAVWGDTQHLYAVGDKGVALRSANRGNSWKAIETGTTDAIYAALTHEDLVYLAGEDKLLLRCDNKACVTLSSFKNIMGEEGVPAYVSYAFIEAQKKQETPALTKMIYANGTLWLAGEEGALFFSKTPAEAKSLEDWTAPEYRSVHEEILSLVAAPSGEVYVVESQQAFYGLEKAKRGIASRDAALLKEGFRMLLDDPGWFVDAGYAYGGFLATPKDEVDQRFERAIWRFAEQAAGEKGLEALLWSLWGQTTKNPKQAMSAFLYAQTLSPSKERKEPAKALAVCLATITTPNKPAAPIQGWLALWKKIKNTQDGRSVSEAPKNNEEARAALCPSCEAEGAWLLHQMNTVGTEDDFDGFSEDIYHVAFLTPKNKLVAFLSVAKTTNAYGRATERSPLQVEESRESEGLLRLTLKQEEVRDAIYNSTKISEKTTDLFFDLDSQRLVLQLERDGFAPYRKTEQDGRAQQEREATFLYLAQVSVVGDEVQLKGGGCDQTISLKKK